MTPMRSQGAPPLTTSTSSMVISCMVLAPEFTHMIGMCPTGHSHVPAQLQPPGLALFGLALGTFACWRAAISGSSTRFKIARCSRNLPASKVIPGLRPMHLVADGKAGTAADAHAAQVLGLLGVEGLLPKQRRGVHRVRSCLRKGRRVVGHRGAAIGDTRCRGR